MQARKFLEQRRSILVSDKGFTLVELLVTSFLGLIMLGLTLSATTSNRRLYKFDLTRTRINQNMRSALDIMGMDIRQAGENLFSTFPAVEIVNGAAGASDELVIRRNLLDEVFNVCGSIAAGSTNTTIIVADNGQAQAGCDKTSNATSYASWAAKRLAETTDEIDAYMYNRSTRLGQFFSYTGEAGTATQYQLTRSAGTWTNAYPVGSSSLYISEEWRYRVQNGVLQIVTNQDTANALNVIDGVQDFQVVALMQDGTSVNTFVPGDNWALLKALRVTVTGQDTVQGDTMTKTLSADFFPRNILSN